MTTTVFIVLTYRGKNRGKFLGVFNNKEDACYVAVKSGWFYDLVEKTDFDPSFRRGRRTVYRQEGGEDEDGYIEVVEAIVASDQQGNMDLY